jgi:hypothetical protein
MVLRKWWDRVQIPVIKNGFLEQQIGADEERVSCKRGNAVVGRISIKRVGRIQRQDLPVALFRLVKKIDESIGLRP